MGCCPCCIELARYVRRCEVLAAENQRLVAAYTNLVKERNALIAKRSTPKRPRRPRRRR